MIYPINKDKPIVYAHNGLTAGTPTFMVVTRRQIPTEAEANRLFEEIVNAAGFIKLGTGVANTAARACVLHGTIEKPRNGYTTGTSGKATRIRCSTIIRY